MFSYQQTKDRIYNTLQDLNLVVTFCLPSSWFHTNYCSNYDEVIFVSIVSHLLTFFESSTLTQTREEFTKYISVVAARVVVNKNIA